MQVPIAASLVALSNTAFNTSWVSSIRTPRQLCGERTFDIAPSDNRILFSHCLVLGTRMAYNDGHYVATLEPGSAWMILASQGICSFAVALNEDSPSDETVK